MMIKQTIFTHRHCVSLSWFTFFWGCHSWFCNIDDDVAIDLVTVTCAHEKWYLTHQILISFTAVFTASYVGKVVSLSLLYFHVPKSVYCSMQYTKPSTFYRWPFEVTPPTCNQDQIAMLIHRCWTFDGYINLQYSPLKGICSSVAILAKGNTVNFKVPGDILMHNGKMRCQSQKPRHCIDCNLAQK